MVKKLALLVIFGLGLLLSTCDSHFNVEDMVPWYVPYIKTSIDIGGLLADQYRDKDIVITRLTGPDAQNTATTTSYIMLAQDRSPNLPLVAIFDAGLRLQLVVTNQSVSDPRYWFVDPVGNIFLGGFLAKPPQTAGAGWQTVAAPLYSTYNPYFSYNNGSPYYTYFNLSYSTSVVSATLQTALYPAPTTSIFPPIFPLVDISLYPNLFPGYAIASLTVTNANISACNPDYSVSPPVLNLFLTANCQVTTTTSAILNLTTQVFCVRFPLSAATTSPAPASVVPVIFDTGGLISPNYYNFNSYESFLSGIFTGDGFVSSGPTNWNNDAQTVPMVFNHMDGSKGASLQLTLPQYPSANNSNSGTSPLSSVSQRPYYLSGLSDFVVVDGFHKRLFLCKAWWK